MTKRSVKLVSLLFLTLVLGTSARADWDDTPSKSFHLAPPPVPGSLIEKADFQRLFQLQAQRTRTECQSANAMSSPTANTLFGGNDGVLDKKQIQDAAPVLNRALKMASRVSGYFKAEYTRPRPYVTDKKIHPCITLPLSGYRSYPSGHATMGFVGACVLAEIYPQLARVIIEQGTLIGELRVLGGVHHPSDIQAGWSLGRQMCTLIVNNADFRRDVKALRN